MPKLPMLCPLSGKDIIMENYEPSDDIEVVEDKVTGSWRWGTTHRIILRYTCEWVGVSYRRHAVEGLEEDSIDGPYPVTLEEKTIIIYHRESEDVRNKPHPI